MIKLEHVVFPSVEQMLFIIEGMRNPMNSWDKSDSKYCMHRGWDHAGVEDYDLMKRLAKAGTDHRKFMRMMPVMVRITAPLYWWKEFDTYKVGTVANSCSTMHKIQEKEFRLSDFSTDNIFDAHGTQLLLDLIDILNEHRDAFNIETDPIIKKTHWYHMIQLLPSSYNQTRNVMLNYEVLSNIYKARKNHKLDEWVEFCKWIAMIPYSNLIIGGDNA